MTLYVPLDSNFQDDAAILSVSPDAELCYVRSLALAKRLTTDGLISPAHLARLAGDLTAVQAGTVTVADIAAELVREALWAVDEAGWQIVAWLNWNPSRTELDEGRKKASVGGVLGNHRRWHQDEPDDDCPHCDRGDRSPPIGGTDRPRSLSEVKGSEVKGSEGKRKESDARRIFDAWRVSTGKDGAVLDAKRRRLIVARLNEFSVDDLVLAVGGWARSPFHSGTNERNQVYNDLGLLLRDAAHVEQFLDFARGKKVASGEWFDT